MSREGVDMRSRILLVAAFSVALLTPGARAGSSQQPKSRDYSRYEDGGHYNLSWSRSSEELEEMRSKLRAFLWEHWSQRRLGRITATLYSIEGDPTRITFFVEPDESRAWRVATEYESNCCWFHNMQGEEKKLETGTGVYYAVERVVGVRDAKSKDFRSTWSVIPENEKRRPDTYALRLRKRVKGQEDNSDEVAFIL